MLWLIFGVSGLATIVFRAALYGELRRVVTDLEPWMWGTIPYLELAYLRNRKNARTLKLDMLALASIVSPIVCVATAIWISRLPDTY
jgi:hypothetical protein